MHELLVLHIRELAVAADGSSFTLSMSRSSGTPKATPRVHASPERRNSDATVAVIIRPDGEELLEAVL